MTFVSQCSINRQRTGKYLVDLETSLRRGFSLHKSAKESPNMFYIQDRMVQCAGPKEGLITRECHGLMMCG